MNCHLHIRDVFEQSPMNESPIIISNKIKHPQFSSGAFYHVNYIRNQQHREELTYNLTSMNKDNSRKYAITTHHSDDDDENNEEDHQTTRRSIFEMSKQKKLEQQQQHIDEALENNTSSNHHDHHHHLHPISTLRQQHRNQQVMSSSSASSSASSQQQQQLRNFTHNNNNQNLQSATTSNNTSMRMSSTSLVHLLLNNNTSGINNSSKKGNININHSSNSYYTNSNASQQQQVKNPNDISTTMMIGLSTPLSMSAAAIHSLGPAAIGAIATVQNRMLMKQQEQQNINGATQTTRLRRVPNPTETPPSTSWSHESSGRKDQQQQQQQWQQDASPTIKIRRRSSNMLFNLEEIVADFLSKKEETDRIRNKYEMRDKIDIAAELVIDNYFAKRKEVSNGGAPPSQSTTFTSSQVKGLVSRLLSSVMMFSSSSSEHHYCDQKKINHDEVKIVVDDDTPPEPPALMISASSESYAQNNNNNNNNKQLPIIGLSTPNNLSVFDFNNNKNDTTIIPGKNNNTNNNIIGGSADNHLHAHTSSNVSLKNYHSSNSNNVSMFSVNNYNNSTTTNPLFQRSTMIAAPSPLPYSLIPAGSFRSSNSKETSFRHTTTVQQQQHQAGGGSEQGNGLDFGHVNQYQLLMPIGEGCQGVCWLGLNQETNEVRALKQLPRPVSHLNSIRSRLEERRQRRRLEQEIAIMRRCRHPNLVALYEVIDDPNASSIYLIMKFIEHGPLMTLENSGQASQSFSLERTVRFASQLCSALEYIHARRIVHLDIKPENCLLGNDDIVYLADFGVSRLFPHDTAHHHQVMKNSNMNMAHINKKSSENTNLKATACFSHENNTNNNSKLRSDPLISLAGSAYCHSGLGESMNSLAAASMRMPDRNFGGTTLFKPPESMLSDEGTSNHDQQNNYNNTLNGSSAGPTASSPTKGKLSDAQLTALKRADVYALGLTIYIMISGAVPWNLEQMSTSELLEAISSPTPIEVPTFARLDNRTLPKSFRNALSKMLEKNPTKRATAHESNMLWRDVYEELQALQLEEEQKRIEEDEQKIIEEETSKQKDEDQFFEDENHQAKEEQQNNNKAASSHLEVQGVIENNSDSSTNFPVSSGGASTTVGGCNNASTRRTIPYGSSSMLNNRLGSSVSSSTMNPLSSGSQQKRVPYKTGNDNTFIFAHGGSTNDDDDDDEKHLASFASVVETRACSNASFDGDNDDNNALTSIVVDAGVPSLNQGAASTLPNYSFSNNTNKNSSKNHGDSNENNGTRQDNTMFNSSKDAEKIPLIVQPSSSSSAASRLLLPSPLARTNTMPDEMCESSNNNDTTDDDNTINNSSKDNNKEKEESFDSQQQQRQQNSTSTRLRRLSRA